MRLPSTPPRTMTESARKRPEVNRMHHGREVPLVTVGPDNTMRRVRGAPLATATSDTPRWRRGLVVLLLAGLALALLPAAPAQAETEADRLAREVYDMVNDERRQRGLDPVRWDERLAILARDWSHEMRATGYRHRDLSTTDDMRGYGGYSGIGENIAMGQTTAGEVHRGWMRSDGHRANILNPDYDRLGIGIVCAGGRMHATQNFGVYDGTWTGGGELPPVQPIVHDDPSAGTSCATEEAGRAPATPPRQQPPAWALDADGDVEVTAGVTEVEIVVPVPDGPTSAYEVRQRDWERGRTEVLDRSDEPRLELQGLRAEATASYEVHAIGADGLAYDALTVEVATEPLPVGDRELFRAQGQDRYDTAAWIAGGSFADRVVLARGDDPADALAGASLAAVLDAPVLLTRPDRLPDPTLEALQRLEPDEVVVLGGEGAVSDEVVAELEADVDRIAGDSRFETAAMIAERVLEAASQQEEPESWPWLEEPQEAPVDDVDDAEEAEDLEDMPVVWIAEGFRGWPDAIAASAAAAQIGAPLLLVGHDEVPGSTAEIIQGLPEATEIRVAGGSSVVDGSVVTALGATRVSGDDRYATATAIREVLEADFERLDEADGDDERADANVGDPFPPDERADANVGDPFPPDETDRYDEVWLATLRDWPDSLVVAAHAARPWTQATPVFLHGQDTVDRGDLSWLWEHEPSRLRVAGGQQAIADHVLEAVLTGP